MFAQKIGTIILISAILSVFVSAGLAQAQLQQQTSGSSVNSVSAVVSTSSIMAPTDILSPPIGATKSTPINNLGQLKIADDPSKTAALRGTVDFRNGIYTTLSPLPRIVCNNTGVCTSLDLPTIDVNNYLQYTFNLFIALAAVAAVFMITLGGFQYMTTDALQGKEEGREKISNAVKGLILVLASFLILKTINPKFVDIPKNLVEPLNATGTSAALLATVNYDIDRDYIKRTSDAITTASQKIENNKMAVTKLQDELATLQKSGTATKEQIDVITEQIAQLKDDTQNNEQNIEATRAQSYMYQAYFSACSGPNASDASCRKVMSEINNTYELYKDKVGTDQKNTLTDQKSYYGADNKILLAKSDFNTEWNNTLPHDDKSLARLKVKYLGIAAKEVQTYARNGSNPVYAESLKSQYEITSNAINSVTLIPKL